MANGDTSGIWKWIATTLGGALLGSAMVMVVSSYQVQTLATQIRNHESLPAHAVSEARMESINGDIQELKGMLREAIAKMDRYHEARQ